MNGHRSYYNEIDPYCCEWLRNLITAGLITDGEIDSRSILDVQPLDLRGFTRCHFFAGIGVWDYALGLAGWPAERPVWTGSCPCQPFSAAGGRSGFADERHLWPAFFHLIRERQPATVLGEQVASKDGLGWLDLVQADLEGEGYAVGAADLCAPGEGLDGEGFAEDEWLQRAILDCPDPILADELRDYAVWARGSISLGAPHIRQRLWFVAHANGGDAGAERQQRSGEQRQQSEDRVVGVLAHSSGQRRDGRELTGTTGTSADRGTEAPGRRAAGVREPEGHGAAGPLAYAPNVGRGESCPDAGGIAPGDRSEGWPSGSLPGSAACFMGDAGRQHDEHNAGSLPSEEGASFGRRDNGPFSTSAASEFWSGADWIACRDGKARPVESGSSPLVDGAAFRLGSGSAYEGRSRAAMLKGYGNAINARRARGFIQACLEVRP